MSQVIELLFTRVWWSYGPQADGFSQVYRAMNLVEGCFWLTFAALVALRYAKHRHSAWELAYAAAFLVFGLSDFREAISLPSWLILLKGAILAAIVFLRRLVIRRFYPHSRTY